MKALSLRQPWANAVLRLGKTIENRRWNTSFRGEFLIHAAKGMTRKEYLAASDFCLNALGFSRLLDIDEAFEDRTGRDITRGAIIGRAELVGVVRPRPEFVREGVETHYPASHRDAWRWHMSDQYGFLLANVVEFAHPIPCSGSLGFFDVPVDRFGGVVENEP